ncbi:Adenosine deaminase CECR1 [Fusarium oxysporum f. sp. cubense race 1]|uniref:adenosine deaminase n=1 Tax=Fusarium oxysporum f. sp. cubense (strain race 1) TaxID=1229664 RepID=N4U2Q6_FUSC1|nr:Adenosine deaminase CECR1 [Fusarium oxysporum f. sp. cubense race 1]
MGALCSRTEPVEGAQDDYDQHHRKDHSHTDFMTRLSKRAKISRMGEPALDDAAAARNHIQAHDAEITARGVLIEKADVTDTVTQEPGVVGEYFKLRQQMVAREKALDFDHGCRMRSTPEERRADAIIQRLRSEDEENVYAQAAPRTGYGGQQHPRFPGDHFLSNKHLIDQTSLFRVAQHMPKGGHLHIHFNACLAPQVLLNLAKEMDRMFPGYYATDSTNVDEWLFEKLMFHEEEAHNHLQTASGAWEKFNGRTRMMKGLFNYATAYRRYTRLCLEDFMKDNISYAEIRPNFMTSNQLWSDDGTQLIDNKGIMELIIEEVINFQTDMKKQGKFFGGLKVIYCTPRSFAPAQIDAALTECLKFKQMWPEWIAGFDLVGEESKGRPIKDFIPELLKFQEDCDRGGVEVPFLFHCGETLDMGTDTDGNLVDALLLKSKRIGHGFALAKHPYVMQHMKERGVCLELCPISNEILGLTPRVSGHTMYQLLANNVHCTVSSDNGTLFRSSLSHDFYQVLVGKADMGLFGWKQLALWSLEHACLSESEYNRVFSDWEQKWKEFIKWMIEEYDEQPKVV